MKIGIDLLPLQSDPNRRGISNFTYHMVKSIIENDQINEYVLFNAKGIKLPEFIKPNVCIHENNITKEKSRELDIFHYTSFFDFEKEMIYPSDIDCIKIVTVYDLIPVIFWGNYINFFPDATKSEYFRRLGYLKTFDRILTISEASKNDIVELLDIPSNKIDVVYAGIDDKFFSSSSDFKLDILKFGINKKYIMSTPSMDFRKNIYRLIDAYAKLPHKYTTEYQLVIVCELNEQFQKLLKEHAILKGVNDRDMILTNYVSDNDLLSLYGDASVFVFPSLYEGFGLPILEAMACKVPVITSNNSSLSEIAEDAAILIDPFNSDEISNAIRTVLADENIRNDLVVKGLKKAKKFSWKNVAELTIKSYERSFHINNSSIKLGMVTTWNTKCGIAEYSKYLLEEFTRFDDITEITIFSNFEKNLLKEDAPNIIRCWNTYTDNLHKLYEEISFRNINVVHFQFNYGLFNFKSFTSLIKKLKKDNIKTICTFHSTEDVKLLNKSIGLGDFTEDIKLIDKILVHTKKDIDKLATLGLDKNVLLLSQGYKIVPDRGKEIIRGEIGLPNSLIISTFGFLLPHKGILEVIKSLNAIKSTYKDVLFFIVCSLYPADISLKYYNACREEVEKLGLTKNVLFFTQYLEESEIMTLLQASDIILMAYSESKESSSAAIRFALSSHRATIVTKVKIFNEFDKEVIKIDTNDPQIIAKSIIGLYQNDMLQNELINNAMKKVFDNSWHNISKEYYSIIANDDSKTKNLGT